VASNRPSSALAGAGTAARSARERVGELVRELVDRQLTMATAESLTGGLCSYLLVDEPDSGQVMLGSVVAYSADEKRRILCVDASAVVSDECALQMVVGVQRLFGARCAVSFTGVAGPSEVEGKPVGTVHIGIACGEHHRAFGVRFDGDPDEIRLQAIAVAVERLLDLLDEPD
jgi:PncC family amidohydrolase